MDYVTNATNGLGILYETTRKAKQYRKNVVIERIQKQQILAFLDHAQTVIQGLKLRIFYYQLAEQQRENLLKDYMSEFLTQAFNYQRSFNLCCSFRSVFDDNNLSIYDVILRTEQGLPVIRQFLSFVLSLDASQFCSRLEVTLFDSESKKEYLFYYQSKRFNVVSDQFYAIQAGVRLHSKVDSLRVPKEKIDSWLNLLELKWDEFYADIYQKGLTVRCQSETQSELITRFLQKEITKFKKFQKKDWLASEHPLDDFSFSAEDPRFFRLFNYRKAISSHQIKKSNNNLTTAHVVSHDLLKLGLYHKVKQFTFEDLERFPSSIPAGARDFSYRFSNNLFGKVLDKLEYKLELFGFEQTDLIRTNPDLTSQMCLLKVIQNNVILGSSKEDRTEFVLESCKNNRFEDGEYIPDKMGKFFVHHKAHHVDLPDRILSLADQVIIDRDASAAVNISYCYKE